MLWSGLVSRVGASYKVNLIAPFPLGWTCPRKIDYEIMCINAQAIIRFKMFACFLYSQGCRVQPLHKPGAE